LTTIKIIAEQPETKYLQQLAKDLDTVNIKFANVKTDAESDKVEAERDRILLKHQTALAGVAACQHARTAREAAERGEAVLKERQRIQDKTKRILAKGSRCPECDGPGEPCPGLPVPQFFNAGFVEEKISPKDWWIDWTCANETCGQRWRTWPDDPARDEGRSP